ncbi:MAG: hypothetical protein WAW92_02985 [Minisyncoccia bacterium]
MHDRTIGVVRAILDRRLDVSAIAGHWCRGHFGTSWVGGRIKAELVVFNEDGSLVVYREKDAVNRVEYHHGRGFMYFNGAINPLSSHDFSIEGTIRP